ncbi:hypothetical protein ACPCK3_15045, partial [Streptomyces griseoincarnatus]
VHRNAMIWRAVNTALDAAGVHVNADPHDPGLPYPVDLAPELAAAMAARLAGMVTAYRRPEHPVWEPEVHDARPTPAPTEAP